jgi:hypothetical protein
VDVARASDQIDALIDKRAVARAGANFEEMAWKASVRRHHQKLQRARRAEWFEFYYRLASSLRRSAEEFDRRAEQLLLEEGGDKWGA